MFSQHRALMLVVLFVLGPLAGCASIGERVQASKDAPGQINWPEAYDPDQATFFVHHQVDISAPPGVVWDVLIEAETWPSWYDGAENVSVLGSSDVLESDSTFKWKTMGLNFESQVAEFEAPSSLSWESNHRFIDGYHAWLLVPNESGTTLVTDESMRGFLAYMQLIFQPNRLNRWHEQWLKDIKARAESRFQEQTNASLVVR